MLGDGRLPRLKQAPIDGGCTGRGVPAWAENILPGPTSAKPTDVVDAREKQYGLQFKPRDLLQRGELGTRMMRGGGSGGRSGDE